jgi:uncharacterized protein YyaL (SSP411 family)
LTGIARSAPIGHTSILNALDQHLRGLTVVVTGEGSEPLRRAALELPYIDRTVCAPKSAEALGAQHPAKLQLLSAKAAQALVCAGMRCSLPVTSPEALRTQAHEMLAG